MKNRHILNHYLTPLSSTRIIATSSIERQAYFFKGKCIPPDTIKFNFKTFIPSTIMRTL